MRKFTAFLLAIALIFTLAGCFPQGELPGAAGEIDVADDIDNIDGVDEDDDSDDIEVDDDNADDIPEEDVDDDDDDVDDIPEVFVPVISESSSASIHHAWFSGSLFDEYGNRIPLDYYENQKTQFKIGEPFTAVLDTGDTIISHGDFGWTSGEPGHYLSINTDIEGCFSYYDVQIHDVKLDGKNISFNADGSDNPTGYASYDSDVHKISVSITNFWDENPVISCHSVIGEFSKIEVTLTIFEREYPLISPPRYSLLPDGNFAWFEGTLFDTNGDRIYIWDYENPVTQFEIGVQFTAVLDFGEKIIKLDQFKWDNDVWGYLFGIATNVYGLPAEYGVHIHDIILDGNKIPFNAVHAETSTIYTDGESERIYVSITNEWNENPVVSCYSIIGEFSKAEITLTIFETTL